MDVKLLYNPGDRKFKLVREKMLEWEPCPSRDWAPRPPVEQPRRTGKKCCYGQKSGGSICCNSVQSPTHLSHNNTLHNLFDPFQIKWEVYFSNELCSLVVIVLNMFCMHMRMHSCSWIYNTWAWTQFPVSISTRGVNFVRTNMIHLLFLENISDVFEFLKLLRLTITAEFFNTL